MLRLTKPSAQNISLVINYFIDRGDRFVAHWMITNIALHPYAHAFF